MQFPLRSAVFLLAASRRLVFCNGEVYRPTYSSTKTLRNEETKIWHTFKRYSLKVNKLWKKVCESQFPYCFLAYLTTFLDWGRMLHESKIAKNSPSKLGVGLPLPIPGAEPVTLSSCCCCCTLDIGLLSAQPRDCGSSLILFFSSTMNCISPSPQRRSVTSTLVSCCFLGFFLGDISIDWFMVCILDCSGSSSRPGDEVADTVVEPEPEPAPSRSPRGEPGGLDVEAIGCKAASTGTKFLDTPAG